jgi:hypothetical protein
MRANHPLFKETSSYRTHKRQFVWQVLVPVLLASLVIISAGYLTVAGGISQARLLADISLIWLLAPLMIFGLIFLVLLAGLIFVLAQGLKVIPDYTERAQSFFDRLGRKIKRAADVLVAPLVWVKTATAVFSHLIKHS